MSHGTQKNKLCNQIKRALAEKHHACSGFAFTVPSDSILFHSLKFNVLKTEKANQHSAEQCIKTIKGPGCDFPPCLAHQGLLNKRETVSGSISGWFSFPMCHRLTEDSPSPSSAHPESLKGLPWGRKANGLLLEEKHF